MTDATDALMLLAGSVILIGVVTIVMVWLMPLEDPES